MSPFPFIILICIPKSDGVLSCYMQDMKRPFAPMKALDMDAVISDIIDQVKWSDWSPMRVPWMTCWSLLFWSMFLRKKEQTLYFVTNLKLFLGVIHCCLVPMFICSVSSTIWVAEILMCVAKILGVFRFFGVDLEMQKAPCDQSTVINGIHW